MPLENLLILIEKLQKRIDSHGDALRQSEALTRYALIDPLLRELGWDTEDPDVVMPECRIQNNQIADYVLYHDGDPAIVIESKKLAEPLQGGKALDQGILYCAYTGAGYFILTDGNSWELYESGKTSPITSFDLIGESAAGACLKALALWRPSVISGQIAGGESPVIGLPDAQQSTTEPRPAEETTVQSKPPVRDDEGWEPLSEFKPEKKTQFPGKIMFPDGSHALLKHQYKMLTKVVRWLIENDHLSEKQCPIPLGPQSEKSLVDVKPVNSDGTSFSNPKKEGSLYINTHGNFKNKIARVKRLIKHVDQDPAQFRVHFS